MICFLCAAEKGKVVKKEAVLAHGDCAHCGRHMIIVAEGDLRVKSPNADRLPADHPDSSRPGDLH